VRESCWEKKRTCISPNVRLKSLLTKQKGETLWEREEKKRRQAYVRPASSLGLIRRLKGRSPSLRAAKIPRERKNHSRKEGEGGGCACRVSGLEKEDQRRVSLFMPMLNSFQKERRGITNKGGKKAWSHVAIITHAFDGRPR